MMKQLILAYVTLMCLAFPSLAQPRTILMLGDSLTAGYGLEPSGALPVKLQSALRQQGLDVTILNGGVSGDTADQGEARLEWALDEKVDGVIVALGANDALRGLPPTQTRASFGRIMETLKRRKLPVLILGMKAPPNMGPDYGAAFERIFPDMAKDYGAKLYPFFLDGVAADPALNQTDGIHPNDAGVAVLVARLQPVLIDFLSAK